MWPASSNASRGLSAGSAISFTVWSAGSRPVPRKDVRLATPSLSSASQTSTSSAIFAESAPLSVTTEYMMTLYAILASAKGASASYRKNSTNPSQGN